MALVMNSGGGLIGIAIGAAGLVVAGVTGIARGTPGLAGTATAGGGGGIGLTISADACVEIGTICSDVHFGHLTFRPAVSSGTDNFCWQETHRKVIMRASVGTADSASLVICEKKDPTSPSPLAAKRSACKQRDSVVLLRTLPNTTSLLSPLSHRERGRG